MLEIKSEKIDFKRIWEKLVKITQHNHNFTPHKVSSTWAPWWRCPSCSINQWENPSASIPITNKISPVKQLELQRVNNYQVFHLVKSGLCWEIRNQLQRGLELWACPKLASRLLQGGERQIGLWRRLCLLGDLLMVLFV